MTVLEELLKLSSAEEFFQFLDVPYDPALLNVARLHILRRMGDNLRKCRIEEEEDALRDRFREHLQHAYQDFVTSTPLNERLFKVLKDAVRRKAPSLIPLSLPGEPGRLSSGIRKNLDGD